MPIRVKKCGGGQNLKKNNKRDPSLIREMRAHRWVVEVISANVTDFNETSIVVVQCPLSMNVA